MKPWIELDRSPLPGSREELILGQRGDDFIIRVENTDLMTSRMSSSEEALASMTAYRCPPTPAMRVLVGGLGMGFTTAAALEAFPEDTEVVTAELLPKVVEWNERFYGHLAGHPLKNPRSTIHIGDVGALFSQHTSHFDAIMLDVDNGPDDLTVVENQRLYGRRGLSIAQNALHPGGVLAIWSAFRDDEFTRRLESVGFEVEFKGVRAHKGRGQKHFIWFAQKPGGATRRPLPSSSSQDE